MYLPRNNANESLVLVATEREELNSVEPSCSGAQGSDCWPNSSELASPWEGPQTLEVMICSGLPWLKAGTTSVSSLFLKKQIMKHVSKHCPLTNRVVWESRCGIGGVDEPADQSSDLGTQRVYPQRDLSCPAGFEECFVLNSHYFVYAPNGLWVNSRARVSWV